MSFPVTSYQQINKIPSKVVLEEQLVTQVHLCQYSLYPERDGVCFCLLFLAHDWFTRCCITVRAQNWKYHDFHFSALFLRTTLFLAAFRAHCQFPYTVFWSIMSSASKFSVSVLSSSHKLHLSHVQSLAAQAVCFHDWKRQQCLGRQIQGEHCSAMCATQAP